MPANLPALDPASAAHGEQVYTHLKNRILESTSQSITFEEWMDAALYEPGLGYYVAGSHKLGSPELPAGDFTTAPELTPLFGFTVANQVAQVIQACGQANVFEFGAGSGALAHAVLTGLTQQNINANYFILEVSPDLQERQKQCLAQFANQVTWVNALPDEFTGCVLANEVLDAMPVKMFGWSNSDNPELLEMHVELINNNTFEFVGKPANNNLKSVITNRLPPMAGYISEVNLRAEAWVKGMGSWLKKGAALLFDYGFPQAEYYHPQRAQGTLMCHFRHHAHAQPLILAGLQDITAHVDFTAMADAALEGGLNVLGYTSQANFLINAGLPEILQSSNAQAHVNTMSAVQKLLSEAEMGELFKVLALGVGLNNEQQLIGFSSGDRTHRL